MRLTGLFCAAICALASPAAADLTVTQTTSGKAMIMNLGGEGVTRIKGNKMRIDSTRGNDTETLIIDIDGQRMISLNAKKKEAIVTPLAKIQEAMGQMATADVQAKVTPTGETKQVAGYSCTVHDVSVSLPFSPGGDMQLSMVMSGPACLSKEAPGYEDWARLYRAAAEKGFIFGDPRAAKGPAAAQAKGLASLYRSMADAGITLEQQMNVGFEGSGPMAAMMNRMGKSTIGVVVTKVDTADVPADLFEIPAGFKVKTEN
ncbi:MAG TPA: DUF4412 domain-containing protein [Vicinamibacterales bacterium]